jgi:ketosteroid isomerase-like protein
MAMAEADRLRMVEDRLDLVDLIYRYAHVIDYARDPAEILGVFTDDAYLVGPYRGVTNGRPDLDEYASSVIEMRKTVPFRHDLTNVRVHVEGDAAKITSLFSLVYTHSIYGGRVELSKTLLGRFEAEARRVSGQWLLSRRVVRLDAVPEQ